jgi:predicted lipoprotein
MISNTHSLLLLLIAMFVLTGCGASSSSSSATTNTELEVAASNIIDNVIIPATNDFQTQAQKLDDDAHSFCSAMANLTNASLIGLQETWLATASAWYTLLPYKFGPMETSVIVPHYLYIDSYRNDHTDRSTNVANNISAIVADTDEITDDYFTNATPSSVGLLPIEIIFNVYTDVNNYSTPNDRLCSLLKAYTTQLSYRANIIADGWSVNYRNSGESYRTLLLSKKLDIVLDDEDGSSAISKILVGIQDYFDYLTRRNVTTDQAKISDTIWRHLLASINSVNTVLNEDNNGYVNILALMINNGYEQEANTVKSNMALMLSTININSTSSTDPTNMKNAAALLDGNFKREIADGLGVNAGLNFSDGD